MQLTTNFHLDEFACRDGTPVPEKYYDNVRGLACNLQVIRDHFNRGVFVTSGYRTVTYNAKVGGAAHSFHLIAMAADIVISGVSPVEVADFIKKEIVAGRLWQGGVGVYGTFTHYDIRGFAARWHG